MEKERLQKYLANYGLCSRRKAEEHILNGDVIEDILVINKNLSLLLNMNSFSFFS